MSFMYPKVSPDSLHHLHANTLRVRDRILMQGEAEHSCRCEKSFSALSPLAQMRKDLLARSEEVLSLFAQAVVATIAAEFFGRLEAKVVEQEAPAALLSGDELLHGGQLFLVGLG